MPWTPAQRRLFAVQMKRGEISRKEFDRRMAEGTRKDVDRSGHARKKRKAKRSKLKRSTSTIRRKVKRAAKRTTRRRKRTTRR